MNDALVQLVVHAVKEQYISEKSFYATQLGITPQSWDRWKKGEQGLKPHNWLKLMTLFSDYEAMMVMKVSRNAEIIQDVQLNPVAEFMNMKLHVARKWINSGLAQVEMFQEKEQEDGEPRRIPATILRVELSYDFWSYKDRIDFRFPGVKRKELDMEKQELLEWLEEEVQSNMATHN
ncbi:hypothetical protein [Atopococcus tabaci]|uniref:hypothetical protein n=1 Tax=Atopococcus tabaci TaxID=269774 RepID=UPI0003F5FC70|nr:hypothetical protein [Atopococcus tabaci]